MIRVLENLPLRAVSRERCRLENAHDGSNPPTNKRINAMTNNTVGIEQTDEKILALGVSDEALETAAGTLKEKTNFTLGACTGLSECPG